MTREEAIAILEVSKHMATSGRMYNQAVDMAIEALQADAKPTVIRAKTFMRKEDFDKWAEDIKKQGENIICIPCDAEVASAEAEQGVWEHIESKLADNMFKCSKCGNPLIIPTVDGEPIYNYCLHCGAKMGNAWGERND